MSPLARALVLASAVAASADTSLWFGAKHFVTSEPGLARAARVKDAPLTASANAHAAVLVLGQRTSGTVTADEGKQISALLTPLIFDRPSVLLSVQLVGAPASSLETLAVGAASRPLLADSSTAVAAALSQLPAAPLPGCAPAAESFVQELACFSSAARAGAARHALAPASPLILAARLSLFAAGDEAALLEALHAATEALGASAASGAALQLVLLDDHPMAPLPSGAAAAGGEWGHEASRRSLLQSGASPRSVDAWHAKVAAFGVGILLAVAIAGTIVALCTMQTQNDSMLFAKTKEL